MSIDFKCPACGQHESVPDSMAGQKVPCRQCGRKIRLPGEPAAQPPPGEVETPSAPYTCTVCSGQFEVTDVYDQDGAVICKACFAARQPGASGGADWSDADGDDPEQAPLTCAACGVAVPPDQVEEWAGRLVCARCATLAAGRATSPSVAVTRRPVSRPASKTPWIVGGIVAAVVLVVVVLFVRMGSTTRADGPTLATTSASLTAPPPRAHVADTPAAPAAPQVITSAQVLPDLIDLRRQGLQQEQANDLKAASATYARLIQEAKTVSAPNDAIRQQIKTAEAALAVIQAKLAPAPSSSPNVPTVAGRDKTAPPKPDATSAATRPTGSDSTATAAPPAPGGNWEQQRAVQIRALLTQADARLAANDTFKAALVYQQLFQVVGTHLSEIQDAALRRKVQAAANTRGKLLVELKSSPETVRLTADTLLTSGLAALQENRWQAGLESLADVRALFDKNIKLSDRVREPKYLMALDGMAVAYLKLKETPKAGELFDDTAPLGKATDIDPTREMVINRAALDIIQRTKAMRAAKSLTTYLQKHPRNAPDEDLLNLLGTALFVAEQHATGKSKLEEYAVIYKRENDRLEQTRPGEKRWGIEWLPEREADRKLAERQRALDEFAKYNRQAGAAYADWQHLQELNNTFNAYGVRKASIAQVDSAERTYNGLANAAREAQQKIPDMAWLSDIQPVLPPLPGGITAIASAGPTGTSSSADTPGQIFTIPPVVMHDSPKPSMADSSPGASEPPVTPTTPKPPVHIAVPRHALAFPIDKARLITAAEVVGNIQQVRMEDSAGQAYSAHVVAKNDTLALLELDAGQPRFSTYLNLAASFAGGPVQCSCVPQENIFGPQPASLPGQAGPAPSQGPWMISLADHPRLAGSPLLNEQRQVIGVVIAKRDDVRTRLPAVGLAALREFLTANGGAAPTPSPAPDPMNVLEVTVQEN